MLFPNYPYRIWEEELTEKMISPSQADGILEKLIVFGNAVQGNLLTKTHLMEAGLQPAYSVFLRNSLLMFFSRPYYEPGGHVAIVGYIPQRATIHISSYYLSNSHCVWRYLVDYTFDEEGLITNYGKGYGEESVTLAYPLQRALAHISGFAPPITITNGHLIFFGTIKRHGRGWMNAYTKLQRVPHRLAGNFYHVHPLARIAPQDAVFYDIGQAPDFSTRIAHWRQSSPLYGIISVNVVSSHDKNYRYTLCEDRYERVWVGAIEKKSRITPLGLPIAWVKGGALTVPAYEYSTPEVQGQPLQYENKAMKHGPYVDMHVHYIKQIPFVQEYQKRHHGN